MFETGMNDVTEKTNRTTVRIAWMAAASGRNDLVHSLMRVGKNKCELCKLLGTRSAIQSCVCVCGCVWIIAEGRIKPFLVITSAYFSNKAESLPRSNVKLSLVAGSKFNRH